MPIIKSQSACQVLLDFNDHWKNHGATLSSGEKELADFISDFIFDIGPIYRPTRSGSSINNFNSFFPGIPE